jgi:crotonobetainyl-CoA:carnitine CoA-transferase CaiB-like acyl-CoA transferase
MTLLQDLRVVEISANGSAATAAKHFADWGARVTVIEPPGGTPLREAVPWFEAGGKRHSAAWAWLSRGKVAVNRPVNPADARALCAAADVVFAESELTASVLGLQPAEVRPQFEGKTTFVLISPFATDGPYASYAASDLGIVALGGWAGMIGDPDREPLRPGGEIVYRTAGLFAAVAAMAALRHLRHGGTPQFVDLSAQAVATSVIVSPWLMKSMQGITQGRAGVKWPNTVGECKDGYVGVSPLTAAHWEMLCQMMGIADVLDEPGGREPAYRASHSEELYARVRPWLSEHTRDEVVTLAQSWRLPSASVQNVAQRLECPQLEARGFWREAKVEGRTVKVPRVPYSIEGAPPAVRGPLQQQEFGPIAGAVLSPAASGSAPARPFEGIRVLDLTWFWSGPYATMMLGALGAEVLKIESVQRPDSYRYTAANSALDIWYERGPLWNDTNCDKRGITLDLNSAEGMKLFRQLAQQADIVISNFSNRVMPNLGLTPEKILEINPKLISVTMPGYGMGGPWENWVGYGVAFEQLGVCASITGYPDSVPRIPGGFCDPVVGVHAVMAIELALLRRERTGEGAIVEVPQSETLESLWAPEHIAVQHGAPVPTRRANKHEWMAPHNVYRVTGHDNWLSIAVSTDDEFTALVNALSLAGLADDPLFATVAVRKANEATLDEQLAAALKDRDGRETECLLQGHGVKACRVAKPPELTEDENLAHLDFFMELTRPITGTHRFKLWPFRFSGIETSHRRPPPLLGQHTREVLRSMLGLSDEALDDLEAAHVIGTVPIGFNG